MAKETVRIIGLHGLCKMCRAEKKQCDDKDSPKSYGFECDDFRAKAQ